ncbi:hypothetical protein Tco_0532418 [Tanacetum coccineum]
MGRDTIQLANVLSTISQEYLLEFTSEYGIPEGLHPELLGPEETIVEFSEGKVGVYTKFFEFANFCILISQFLFDILGYYQIHLSQLSVIGAAKQTTREKHPTVLYKTPGLFEKLEQSVFLGGRENIFHRRGLAHKCPEGWDASSELLFRGGHMDLFNLISASNPTKVKTGTRPRAAHEDEVAYEIPPTRNASTTGVALETGLEEEVAAMGPQVNKRRRKRCNDEADTNTLPKVLRKDHVALRPVQSALGGKSLATMGLDVCSTLITPAIQETPSNAKSVNDPDPLSYAKPHSRPEQDVAQLLKKAKAHIARWDQRIQVREEEIKKMDQEIKSLKTVETEVRSLRNQAKNSETLLEAEVDMKKAAEAKTVGLAKELESLRAQFADLQFKKYKDNRVSSWCAEIDTRLDAMNIDFNKELYPHILTAIASRRWVIRHSLRLAVMKCVESTELRYVFANVVSTGIANGMSEGLKHGIEHGKANLDLAAIEVYDPEADIKYVAALHALKDLKYPLIDQLEKLKDAPIDLIMTSLYLESDYREDAPQWIRELRPSSSQLNIPVYPEVRDPKDPSSFKEEIMLEDAIAANISRAKKKKNCLAILLADAATHTQISEDEASPRLLRSKSLPPIYNLD